jgi:hypothetical protein
MAENDVALPADSMGEEVDHVQDEEEEEVEDGMHEGTAGQQQTGSNNRKRALHPSSLQNLQSKPCPVENADGTTCGGSITGRWVCSRC